MMERRDLFWLAATAAAAAGVGSNAAAQPLPSQARPTQDTDAKLSVIRIYATPDGESHLQELPIVSGAKPLAMQQVTVNAYRPAAVAWHTVPQKQFTINMTGELEVEVSSGTKRRIGPGDLVYLEDLTGKGHLTRLLTPVTNLFLRVPANFDIVAWAKGG